MVTPSSLLSLLSCAHRSQSMEVSTMRVPKVLRPVVYSDVVTIVLVRQYGTVKEISVEGS